MTRPLTDPRRSGGLGGPKQRDCGCAAVDCIEPSTVMCLASHSTSINTIPAVIMTLPSCRILSTMAGRCRMATGRGVLVRAYYIELSGSGLSTICGFVVGIVSLHDARRHHFCQTWWLVMSGLRLGLDWFRFWICVCFCICPFLVNKQMVSGVLCRFYFTSGTGFLADAHNCTRRIKK